MEAEQPEERAHVAVAQFTSLLLGLSSSVCFVFATMTPCWYVTYADASISPYENCYGLWGFCSSTGLCGKWFSGSLLAPHGTQRTSCRGLMISACILGGFGILLNILGMNCVLLFNLKNKSTIAHTAALVYFTGGTCSLVSSSWYALDVMHSARVEGKPIEMSDGIFCGWSGAGLAFASTFLLCMDKILLRKTSKKQNCQNIVPPSRLQPRFSMDGRIQNLPSWRLSSSRQNVTFVRGIPQEIFFKSPQRITYM